MSPPSVLRWQSTEYLALFRVLARYAAGRGGRVDVDAALQWLPRPLDPYANTLNRCTLGTKPWPASLSEDSLERFEAWIKEISASASHEGLVPATLSGSIADAYVEARVSFVHSLAFMITNRPDFDALIGADLHRLWIELARFYESNSSLPLDGAEVRALLDKLSVIAEDRCSMYVLRVHVHQVLCILDAYGVDLSPIGEAARALVLDWPSRFVAALPSSISEPVAVALSIRRPATSES